MPDYIMTCASGAVVLVSARSQTEAEDDWDEAAASGEAEPRISSAREPYPSEVDACVLAGHDYRDDVEAP